MQQTSVFSRYHRCKRPTQIRNSQNKIDETVKQLPLRASVTFSLGEGFWKLKYMTKDPLEFLEVHQRQRSNIPVENTKSAHPCQQGDQSKRVLPNQKTPLCIKKVDPLYYFVFLFQLGSFGQSFTPFSPTISQLFSCISDPKNNRNLMMLIL